MEVRRSTNTRRRVWSATHPQRLGPKIRITCIIDIKMPICVAEMFLSAKYKLA